jgi:putative membrane protein
MGSRFPRWVYSEGAEPDPRFTLANERTFLAWIRTALALLAGGVALEALSVPMHPGLRLAASILLVVAGMIAPVAAWWSWGTTERALRAGKPLPSSALLVLPLSAVVAMVGLLVLGGLVLQ